MHHCPQQGSPGKVSFLELWCLAYRSGERDLGILGQEAQEGRNLCS
jgi:hypothetical protein